MNIRTIIGLAAGILCLSCQSNSYQIQGYSRTCIEGDTICMVDETANDLPFAYAIVSKGKFRFEGEVTADSVRMCIAYVKRQPDYRTAFFLEPGDITVEIDTLQTRCRVSGSRVNNEWQRLNDSIERMSQELYCVLADSAHIDLSNRIKAVDSLHRCLSDCILNTAQRNHDNILGRYINENYKAPEFK